MSLRLPLHISKKRSAKGLADLFRAVSGLIVMAGLVTFVQQGVSGDRPSPSASGDVSRAAMALPLHADTIRDDRAHGAPSDTLLRTLLNEGRARTVVAPSDTTDPDSLEPAPARIERVPVGGAPLRPLDPADLRPPSNLIGPDDPPLPSAVADTGRASFYLPSSPLRAPPALFAPSRPFLSPTERSARPDIQLADSGRGYQIRSTSDGARMRLGAATYRRERFQANLRSSWQQLAEQRQQQRDRGGLGVNVVVPGGRESAFSTIFGKPQVDLRINGQADINAGFNYRQSDRQGAITGDDSQIDPDFKQDLRLGINGTIGDKLQIDVDWDTNNQFDYQNQVKLKYTGYEDEIVQSVEAGNVFLETPSQLIRGGQSLFGIKSAFQLGNLNLTTVASQQEGQSNSLSIEGGAETTTIDLQPTDYDDNTHFFLGYFFRNRWEDALSDPPNIRVPAGFNGISDVEVWKLQTSQLEEDVDTRKAVAVVDLGEPVNLLTDADAFTEAVFPDASIDQYDDQALATLRDGEASASTFLTSSAQLQQPLGAQDFVDGEFKKLERGRDYTIDDRLGFLSLAQRLRSNEAVAIAFRYRTSGGVRTVGDFAEGGSTGGINADRLVLKLLRPTEPVAPSATVRPPAWFLQMRNIYRLRGRGFTADNFELDIRYEPSGQTKSNTIAGVTGQQTLLQALGLDRIDQNGAPNPDEQFDFTSLTIDPGEGLLIFPYLQPFGQRIVDVAAENGTASAGEEVAFRSLYTNKRENAQENTERNVYHIRGEFKGATKQFYDLKAFAGLVEGSVTVESGGQTLQEGTDYVVDYQGGTVTITNPTYLADGRDVNISYEQNSFANLQRKTLLGARADWAMDDRFALGATAMRLSQRSPADKFRVGEEPIRNTIWGVDGSLDLQPRWLTRAVDALPLVETRAESALSLSGEFAQLRPGHTDTEAFERTRSELQDVGQDFTSDELGGISYIDDFEGFENTFSLRQQLNAWQISAAPDSTADRPVLDRDVPGTQDDLERTFWRGSFGWYQLNDNLREALADRVSVRGDPGAIEILEVDDIFNRDTSGDVNPTLRTLDFHFDPWARGPYNYTTDLEGFLNTPTQVWGGITRRLPQGYTDFSLQNVEFVEFIVRVFPQEGQVTDGAKLFVDLGSISEDVIPNETLNDEDGLPSTFQPGDVQELSRIASGPQNGVIDISGQVTEDLGLDGLVSYDPSSYNPGATEEQVYADFLAAVEQTNCATTPRPALCEAEVAKAFDDPSGDDYHFFENDAYFENAALFPNGATLQQRFSRYYAGHELNGFQTQNDLATGVTAARGLSRSPDTEDLDATGGSVDIINDYYQYAIPLDDLDRLAEVDEGPTDYVVSEVFNDGQPTQWYKVRIPVRDFTRKVGTIEDFTRIRAIRMWTTGHAAPVTMRLASLELVGSQWRTSTPIAEEPVENNERATVSEGELRVASINDEEDAAYKAPVGAIVSRNRTARGVQQRSREQALLLSMDQLEPNEQRGVFKAVNRGLDLLKYRNLRMYVHAHGQNPDAITENLKLFVRLGANQGDDYYEIEQPLTGERPPTPSTPAVDLWREENAVNLELSALNRLKVARDRSSTAPDSIFSSVEAGINTDFDGDPATPAPVLRMRGTPSLRTINTLVIGLRHEGETTQRLDRVEVWANELRVTGYDERPGWAAVTNASVDMADVLSVQGNFQRETDGFGALSSTLADRQQSDNTTWNVRTDVQLDKLLPERQGWQIPVTLQTQSSTTTPRFDPRRGDVRVEEIVEQIELADSLSADEKDRRTTEIIEGAKTQNVRRTVTASIAKQDSDSWWLRQTMDATSLSFNYFDRTASSPDLRTNDQWSWSGSFEYRLQFGPPRTIQPFGFLPEVPILGALGTLNFNYVPQTVGFTGSAERNVQTRKNRGAALPDPDALPDRILNPNRTQQEFTHRRGFNLQYNPFEFLSLSFDTNTRQSLNEVAGRTQTNILVLDEFGDVVTVADVDTASFFRDPGRFVDVPIDSTITQDDVGTSVFIEEQLEIRPESDVANSVFFGGGSPRTNDYQQRFTATLRPGLLDSKSFNWVELEDIVYRSSFDWRNGAEGSLTGANVQNSVTLRTGIRFQPNKVWERFGFFQRLKDAEQSSGSSGRASRGRSRRPAPEDEDPSRADDDDESASESDEDQEDQEDEENEEDDGRSLLSKLPLPSPISWARKAALTVLDIRDLSISYTADRASRASNVGRPTAFDTTDTGVVVPTDVAVDYSLLDAFRGDGPSLGYRFGFSRSIDPFSERALLEQTQATDAFTNGNRLEARTTLSPSRSFQIDLNWDLQWDTQRNLSYRPLAEVGDEVDLPEDIQRTDDGLAFQQITDQSGNTRASVWAFGSYSALVEAQVEALRSLTEQSASDTLAAADVALANASVADDFREAFLVGFGAVGTQNTLPLPMPNWSVRYSGIGSWPLIRRVTQSFSLEHRYSGTYRSQYASVAAEGEVTSLSIGGSEFRYERPGFEVSASQISERFEPLLGADITWLGNLQTTLDWNKRLTTSLRTASLQVNEQATNELSARISYSKTGLDIPLLPIGRLNNRIQFTLTLERSVNDERSFNMRRVLEDAASQGEAFDLAQAEQGDNVSITTQTTRLTIAPELSYQFSNRVQGNLVLKYEKFEGDGRQPSFTNINGAFRVRVNISEN